VTSRDKDCTLVLLDELDIPHQCLSVHSGGGSLAMARELLLRNRALANVVREFLPDVMAGVGGTSAAQVGWYLGCPTVVFYNTERAHIQNFLTYPFADRIIVPDAYRGWVPKRKGCRYLGYHELARLHPSRFQPDVSVAIANGLDPEGDTFLIRVVSWNASHDIGLKGWSIDTLKRVVGILRQHGRVLISAEEKLPEELEELAYAGSPDALHHVMGHCRLVVGESATMASEAVVMGVPAVYAAPSFRGYIEQQQERFGLAWHVDRPNPDSISSAILNALETDPRELERRHQRLLEECVDVARMAYDELLYAAGAWGSGTDSTARKG